MSNATIGKFSFICICFIIIIGQPRYLCHFKQLELYFVHVHIVILVYVIKGVTSPDRPRYLRFRSELFKSESVR